MTHRVSDLTDRLPVEQIIEEPRGAPSLAAAVEALLLIADEPMDAEDLGTVLNTPPDDITSTVETLQAEYATSGRGFTLRREAGGWRFVTAADCSGSRCRAAGSARSVRSMSTG